MAINAASDLPAMTNRRLCARRKRRCPGVIISFHAILLLLACGSSYHRIGRLSLADALVVPSLPSGHYFISQHRRHGQKNAYTSRVHSTSLLSAATTSVADGSTSTQIKGQTPASKQSSAPNTKRKRSKQKSSRKGNYRSNKTKSRIIQRSSRTDSTPSDPWDADYATSLRTQRKIQAAAYKQRGSGNDPVKSAHAVLQTLLKSPPTECNAANIVCALTLSSKTLNQRRRSSSDEQSVSKESRAFQKSLIKTLHVLSTLVTARKLTPRQLCNAAWSVAKHVEHDPALFARSHDNYVLVKDGGSKSSWDLRDQRANGEEDAGDAGLSDELIDSLLNLIALRVVEHLKETRLEGYGSRSNNKRRVRPGELSMLLWAYAVAKPRDCPPGWEQPRRMARLSNGEEEAESPENGNGDMDFVTFVELDDGSSSPGVKSNDGQSDKPYESTTDKLFDAAAIAFCQGEGAAVKKQYINSNDDGGEHMTLLKNCTWNELSNIAWSYATRGAYSSKESEAMMSFFAREATRRIRHCKHLESSARSKEACDILPRDVIQIAWALGMMESDNVSVGDALVRLVDAINDCWIDGGSELNARPLANWTCADLVMMATALAHGRLDNQSVLMAVYQESLARLRGSGGRGGGPRQKKGFSTAEVSILLWVQARLYLTPKFGDVYDEFPSTASRTLLQRMAGQRNQGQELESGQLLPATSMQRKGLGPQEQANLAWSLTVLENYDDEVVELLQNIFHAASSNDEGMIQLEHAHQLWQSFFLLSKDCPDAVKFVPGKFSRYLEDKWNIEKSRTKQSSSRHRAISQTLDLMRVAHRNEYDEDVDVAIVLEEDSAWTHTAQADFDLDKDEVHHKVAVEFDGPHHFTVMASTEHDLSLMESGVKITPRVLGHTVLKYRLLKKKGWTVVRIPYYEFDKIPIWASMERQRYLQRALKTHDKIEFSGVDVSEYKAMPATRHSRFD